jgi:hypothetical protein
MDTDTKRRLLAVWEVKVRGIKMATEISTFSPLPVPFGHMQAQMRSQSFASKLEASPGKDGDTA